MSRKNQQSEKNLLKEINRKLSAVESISDVFKESDIYKPEGKLFKILEQNKNAFKTTQLRKIFSEIKMIEMEIERKKELTQEVKKRIFRLYPKLAYSKARDLIKEDFYQFFILLLEKMEKNKEEALKVCDVFTSIVAFKKYLES
ncbi:type III-A CRISPR-associated protein Csm2 [Desulfurobacterium atlanticum]|uniref:CRISPR system Cms protein Csm2 n=1 Tax=Desulfurobacterium atlanticum TaxID=240169 RepID=A0A238XW21_9BACT|nr:type III-A CRISPR-associated protein Csm2 [Desulfurobacterium atlanticum]SNR62932.1 CRISPR type III-A/MTUBE-associated protein Csm2 [Desulfurobacterium atlanticum]